MLKASSDWTAQLSQPIISLQNSNKFAVKEELFEISSLYEKSLAKIYSEKLKSFIVYNNISRKEKIRSILCTYPFWNKDT